MSPAMPNALTSDTMGSDNAPTIAIIAAPVTSATATSKSCRPVRSAIAPPIRTPITLAKRYAVRAALAEARDI